MATPGTVLPGHTAAACALFLARWLAAFGLAVRVGGFTFYSAVVIPVLHDEFGGMESGAVTGEVSRTLNGIGVAALAACWLVAVLERRRGLRWARAARLGLLTVTSLVLAGLVVLHPIVVGRLETASLRDFHRLHQVYLIVSSLQWGVNVALIGAFVPAWPAGSDVDRLA